MFAICHLYILTILLGCTLDGKQSESNSFKSDPYIAEFKKHFFLRCIDHGYQGDACMDSILMEDVSPMGDYPLGRTGYRLSDSLAREVRKEIVSDSIRLMTRRDYEIGKKRVFQICLKYYSSGRADSVALKLLSGIPQD